MLSSLQPADWIWKQGDVIPDDYASFYGSFDAKEGKVILYIAADSDYAFYLNGKLVAFGQYQSYEYASYADQIELEIDAGHHEYRIDVYYVGVSSFFTYSKGKPGLLFLLEQDGNVLARSNPEILSRRNPHYEVGKEKIITPQLGFHFFYDSNAEGEDPKPSLIIDKPKPMGLRPNQKCILRGPHKSKLIKVDGSTYLFDLGEETVGLLYLHFISPKQKLSIRYAEHLVEDGRLEYQLGPRDFSFEYTAKDGENEFLMPFRRLGLRYLEIAAVKELSIECATVRPVEYPFEEIPYIIDDPLRQKIYDVSVRTLKCCYHEHYEDCPWREQSLYALDSRNQMLAGYSCFKNTEQVKASLSLFLLDHREDGLLPICAPSDAGLYIPSFSLHFFAAMDEYLAHTGDMAFVKEAYPRLQELLSIFTKREKDGLIETFDGPGAWNFYEWVPSLEGYFKDGSPRRADMILNGLYGLALMHMSSIAKRLGKEDPYLSMLHSLNEHLRSRFYKNGVFVMADYDARPSILGNALAILVGAVQGKEAKALGERLKKGIGFVTTSLSMKAFLYDALLKVDSKNGEWVLSDIDRVYGKMLEDGATTFYETEEGWPAFERAGSLCHGWSAMPIHYYHLLKVGR